MARFLIVCPRCSYEMDFAQTKLRVGDLQQCLRCKLLIKVTKMVIPQKEDNNTFIQVGIKPLITNGVEIESYLIKNDEIVKKAYTLPIKEAIEFESGESFVEDISIGNEYISPVFDDVNEGLFLLKNGLRKYRAFTNERAEYQIGLFGTWWKDPAGTHIHIGLGDEGISKNDARSLMVYLHDYLPFIIALCNNSPVYPGRFTKQPKLTTYPSNRLRVYANQHCKSVTKSTIQKMLSDHWVEINYNDYRKDKPPTIEIRLADSNLPEYVIAAVTILRILTIAHLSGKPPYNELSFKNYQISKRRAIRSGVTGSLYWNNRKMKMATYIDKFFDTFQEEIETEAPNKDILEVFKLAKLGWNSSTILSQSIKNINRIFSSKKFNWRNQFIRQYNEALSSLLDGNNLREFARILYIELPNTDKVILGTKNSP